MITVEQIKALAKIEDFSDRLEAAARLTTGNIVEIGGGEGINTLRFLQVAKERGGKVIVVDPFEQIPGADESYFKPYPIDKFLETTKEFHHFLHIIKLPSQDPRVRYELFKYGPIGLMFIDGIQDADSVFQDLITADLLRSEIICVDDFNRETASSQVPKAVNLFIELGDNYKLISTNREAYIV